MEFFRPIQCYSCFIWGNHLRNECPTKENPICSRCSEYGHLYTDCSNNFCCPNCQGNHSATARICPEYKITVEKLLPVNARQLAYLLNNTANVTPSDNAICTDMLRAAALDSRTKEEFLDSLFKACQCFTADDGNGNTTSPVPVNSYLDDSYSLIPLSDELKTEDRDSFIEEADEELNKEIILASKPDISLTSALPSDLQRPREDDIHTQTSLPEPNSQNGLVNNENESIEEIVAQSDHSVSCYLKDPKNGLTSSYMAYFQQNHLHQRIIFYNNHEKIEIIPDTITGIEIVNKEIIKFITVKHGTYEVNLKDEPRGTSAIELALWLRSAYHLQIMAN